jgi:hypothetical protein
MYFYLVLNVIIVCQRVGLVQSGPHHHLILKSTCSRHDIAEKIAELALNNNR